MLIWAFTVAAVAANTVFVWPQAWRLFRDRSAAGVSPGTWTISVVLFSVWSAYAASIGFWALLGANVSCLVAAVLVMYAGTRSGWSRWWAALGAAGVTLAAAAGFLAPVLLAVVMTGAGVALRIPQLLLLVRSKSVAGVSATTWLLSGATAACWLVVSASRGATAVIVANSTALAATLVLLGVLCARRPAGRQR